MHSGGAEWIVEVALRAAQWRRPPEPAAPPQPSPLATSDTPRPPAAMRLIRIDTKAADATTLTLPLLEQPRPGAPADHCVIEVRSAGVNPSDAKAALGHMPHAVWPRTPGRDYAGLVVDGPQALLGKPVWGCGGDLGIRRDGTHATHLIVPTASVCEIPAGIGLREAGAVGVPFVTAYEGLRRAGLPGPGRSVLVLGANGAVGQAALQIARYLGAHAIAVVRNEQARQACPASPAPIVHLELPEPAAAIRSLTDGHGVDVAFNTVGSPYFALANQCLGIGGHQVFIATTERAVPFDIFAFYRGQQTYHGIDSLALDCTACATILQRLAPGFASGALRPFPIAADSVHTLDDAARAYRRVLAGTRQRLVIEPGAVTAGRAPAEAAR